MALGALSRSKDVADPLALAKENLRQIASKRSAILDGIEGRKISLSILANPSDAADEGRSAWARSKAAPYLAAVTRRPDRAQREILDLQESLDETLSEHKDALLEFEHQKSVRTSEIAKSLMPRQRQAAVKIAAALAELSKAVDGARAIETEFERTAPNPTSTFFIGITGELSSLASLDSHQSVASLWTRRMRKQGILV
jgi:hypothetical protein